MHWLQVVATVVYVAGLIGCGVLVWRLLNGGYPPSRAIQAGYALAPAALLVGLILAAQVVPGSGPWQLSAVYAPYFAVAAWALYFSLLLQRGGELRQAAVRAALITLPSVLLTPLAIGILEFLLPPR